MAKNRSMVIITHGKFGEEIIRSAEMIIGKQDNIFVYSLLPAVDPSDLYEKILEDLTQYKNTEFLFLVDLFGGSPGITASRLTREIDGRVVSGLNLPMLLEVTSQLGIGELDDVIEKGIEASKQSTLNMSKKMEEN